MNMKKIISILLLIACCVAGYFVMQPHTNKDDVTIQAMHGSGGQQHQSNLLSQHQSIRQDLGNRLNARSHHEKGVGYQQINNVGYQATTGQGSVTLASSAIKQGVSIAIVRMYNSAHQTVGQATIMATTPTGQIVPGTESLSVEDGTTHAIIIPEQHVDQYVSYSINYSNGSYYLA